MAAGPKNSAGSLVGRVINGRYDLRQRVGQGSMGEVYIAHHMQLEKDVAVKTILPTVQTDPVIVARFKSEARAASRLEHPNSVRIMDFGEEQDGLLYIVMEYLKGQDLSTVLKRTPRISDFRVLRIMDQVLSALAAAHQNSIVHRDLKPANIMLIKNAVEGTEVVKVCDFGIAKLQDPASPDDPTGMMTMTRAGMVVGTPSYMSPEQAAGKKVDARADLFSCGVIMYHMLTGKKPFKSDTLMGLLSQVITAEPRPVEQCVSTTDPRIAAVVARAMAKKPEDRFQSAREMREALQAVKTAPVDIATPVADAPKQEAAFSESLEERVPARGLHTLPLNRPDATIPTPVSENQFGSSGSHPAAGDQQGNSTSFGGSQTFVRTGVFEAPPPTSTKRGLLVAIAIAIVAIGALWLMTRQTASSAELQNLVALNSWGAAEDYALEHFEPLIDDPLVPGLVAEAMAQRRANYQTEEKNGIRFDSSYAVMPGRWAGQVESINAGTTVAKFFLVIETVEGGRLTGHMDWPDTGIRVAVNGFTVGNHIVMWEYKYLHGKPRRESDFRMYDKVSFLIEGDRLTGVNEHFGTRTHAKKN